MALSDVASDLMWVRSKVGDEPSDDRLDEIFDDDEIGTRELTALWVLENRLANLLANPTGFSLPDVYSETTTSAELVKLIESQISDLRAEIELVVLVDAGESIVGDLTRSDYTARR